MIAHGELAVRRGCDDVLRVCCDRRRRALDHGRDDRKPGKSGNLRHNGPAVGQLRGLAHLGPVVLLPPRDGNGELAAIEVLRQRRSTSNQCATPPARANRAWPAQGVLPGGTSPRYAPRRCAGCAGPPPPPIPTSHRATPGSQSARPSLREAGSGGRARTSAGGPHRPSARRAPHGAVARAELLVL